MADLEPKKIATLLDLPREIFVDGVFPKLDLREFLNLTSVCKELHSLSLDDVYFRRLTHRVFNLPAQTIRTSGWREVFQRIYTARVFTWGECRNGRLGHSWPLKAGEPNSDGVPKQIINYSDMKGTVVDIQAGGWSTSFLTSTGKVYAVGIPLPQYYPGSNKSMFNLLKFPKEDFPDEQDYPKIVEISSGRSHILGLDNEGTVWKWKSNFAEKPAEIWNISDSVAVAGGSDGQKLSSEIVKCVRAGWTTSGVFVTGRGIIIGELEGREDAIIPGTGNLNKSPIKYDQTLGEKIGLVTEFVVCEHFVVFLTHAGEVFVASLEDPAAAPPVQLAKFSAPEGSAKMSYISGSFRNFAVFNTQGMVYLGDSNMVQQALKTTVADINTPPISTVAPNILPDLQNQKIIKISFGDYHRLALTSNGTVLTWGTEPQACGAFGLGPQGDAINRGAEMQDDLVLRKPVQVHFHSTSGYNPEEEKKYFAFNIAAAGWHSGALVSCPLEDGPAEEEDESVAGLVEKPGKGPKNPVDLGRAGPSSVSRHNPVANRPPPAQPGAVPQLPQQTGNPFMINPNVYPLAHPLMSNHLGAVPSQGPVPNQQESENDNDDEDEEMPPAA